MTPIKSIEEELADCRAAFAAHPNTLFAWCIHHEKELELIEEPIENRIAFILKEKAKGEQAIRFRNLRPARNLPTALVKPREAYFESGEAFDKAREAYLKACEARRDAQEAFDKTREAYDKALKAFDKALKAFDKAWEACKAQFSELHTQDWPDHTWAGTSIFQL